MKQANGQTYFSPSDILAYQSCPTRWYYSRVKNLSSSSIIAGTKAMDWGKAFHKIQSMRGVGMPLEHCLDLISLKEDPTGLRTKAHLDAYSEAYEEIREHYNLKTVQTEYPWKYRIKDNVWYRGVIDEVVQDKTGNLGIVELKTTARAPDSTRPIVAALNLQLQSYALAASAIQRKLVRHAWLITIVLRKTAGSPKLPYSSLIHFDRVRLANPLKYYPNIILSINKMLDEMSATEHPKHTANCATYNHVCPYLPLCEVNNYDETLWGDTYHVHPYSGSDRINFKEIPNPIEVLK